MTDPGEKLLDRVVERIAQGLDALGLNGTRLRWRWNRRRRDLAESGMQAAVLWRSASSPHKMCPACRALVPRTAGRCTECGASLAAVRAPGIGRALSNILPGATAATSLLLLANGALFLLMLVSSLRAGTAPGLLSQFDGLSLVRFGSGFSPLTMDRGEWWRLVTPIFLHGGLLHFGFNSYALLQIGPLVEAEYGTERFAFVYLASGILGNLASQSLRTVNTVGASGALCGLIGLLLVFGIRKGGIAGTSFRSAMTQYAVYLLVFSLLPGVDLLCHLGGFAGGFLLGWIVPAGPARSRATAALWDALAFGSIALVLYSFYRVA